MSKIKKGKFTVEKLLSLYEEGKSDKEIIGIFPENEKEIKEIFLLFSELKNGKEFLNPSRNLLDNTLERIENNVTETEKNRYVYKADEKNTGRFGQLKNNNNFMSIFKKLLITGTSIVVIVFIAVGFNHFSGNGKDKFTLSKESQTPIPSVFIAGVETLDEILSDIDKESAQEYSLAKEYDNDYDLATVDAQLINEIGQIYDENTL